jgi:DNA-binding HxlR family transcriptional regulator
MVLLDLLGRRMALRILWELRKSGGPLTFRQLQDAAATNPALLNARLKELRAALLVDHEGDGYVLTRLGRSLSGHMRPLHAWAEDWARLVG